MKRAGLNMGYLAMSGALNPETDGYAPHKKSSTTITRPNTHHRRGWETKLYFSLNRLEKAELRADVFEDKLLDDLELAREGKLVLKKSGKAKKVATPEGLIATAEKSMLALEKSLQGVKDSVARAKREAILAEDKETVGIAEEALSRLTGKLKGIAHRIQKLKEEDGTDSTL